MKNFSDEPTITERDKMTESTNTGKNVGDELTTTDISSIPHWTNTRPNF